MSRYRLALVVILVSFVALSTRVHAADQSMTYTPGAGMAIPSGEAYRIGNQPVLSVDPGPTGCGGSLVSGLCARGGGPDPIMGNTCQGGYTCASLPNDSSASRQNTCTGNGACANLTTGEGRNTGLGAGALQGQAPGTFADDIGVGDNACVFLGTGTKNLCLGNFTGTATSGGTPLVDGHLNTIIGYGAGVSKSGQLGAIALGMGAVATNDHQLMIGSQESPITEFVVWSAGPHKGMNGTITIRARQNCSIVVWNGLIESSTCQ
jgi:hypothetical protein